MLHELVPSALHAHVVHTVSAVTEHARVCTALLGHTVHVVHCRFAVALHADELYVPAGHEALHVLHTVLFTPHAAAMYWLLLQVVHESTRKETSTALLVIIDGSRNNPRSYAMTVKVNVVSETFGCTSRLTVAVGSVGRLAGRLTFSSGVRSAAASAAGTGTGAARALAVVPMYTARE